MSAAKLEDQTRARRSVPRARANRRPGEQRRFQGPGGVEEQARLDRLSFIRPARYHRNSAKWVQPREKVWGGQRQGRRGREKCRRWRWMHNLTHIKHHSTMRDTNNCPYRISFPVLLSTTGNHCTGCCLNIGHGGSTIYHISAIIQHKSQRRTRASKPTAVP